MHYSELYLEKVEVPADAAEKAKKDYEWKFEAAPGIYRMVWFAREVEQRPAFFFQQDNTGGIKHGVCINFADKRMNKLNKTLADKAGGEWLDYIIEEIDQNPILQTSEDAFGLEAQYSTYLWTRKESEAEILLSECSKAIRKLAGEGQEAGLNPELQAALDEEDLSAYAEVLIELLGEESKKTITAAMTGAKPLLKKYLDPELLAVLAAASLVTGLGELEALAKELGLAERIAQEDEDFNDEFILALQRAYQEYLYSGDDWHQSEALVKRYYDNILGVMQAFGYPVKPMAVMTMVFLFYNDIIEGIGYDGYLSDEDYRDDEWPYTDTDLTFWETFDPDTVTGLKTEKGGYVIPDGD